MGRKMENITEQPTPPTVPVADQPPVPAPAIAQTNQQKPLWLAVIAVTALLAGSVGGGIGASIATADGTTQYNNPGVQTSTISATATGLTKIINEKTPSVVTISVTTPQGSGTGSGVVIDEAGHIVTNAHVVTLGGATTEGNITIQTSTGETAPATLVGVDPTSDLAVIKTNLKGLQPITFADSDKTQVGDTTIAIGSPLGLNSTVTTGIISALNRPITVQSSETANQTTTNGRVALNVIQTDAAINSGNSGGALLNSNGDLIGVNVAIASAGENTGNIGVGFAIPSNLAKQVVNDLISNGTRQHGYLGVSVEDHYETQNSTFITGATITSVEPGSPAEEKGLQPGDVVTAVNSTPVESATQFVAFVKQNQPGSELNLSIIRNGNKEEIKTVLTTK